VWTVLKKEAHVPATGPTLWTIVCEYVSGPRKLKFEAHGSWRYSRRIVDSCSPDGDPGSPVDRSKCLKADAAVGALIGKIGGSTAGKSDGVVFIVGSFCIVDVPDKTAGTLFLTINDEESGFSDNEGEVTVSVYDAP
jgi:hypothetical protein